MVSSRLWKTQLLQRQSLSVLIVRLEYSMAVSECFINWKSWSVLIADEVDPLIPQGLRSMGFGVVRETNSSLEDDQLLSMIPNYDVLVVTDVTDVTREVLEAGCFGGRLKVIAKAGVGFDNIDCQAISDYSVVFLHTPDAYTLSATELTCALLMALYRNLPQACDSMRKLTGVKVFGVSRDINDKDCQMHHQINFRNNCDWNRNVFTGAELYGKVLGLIGLGRVGLEVAKRMASFDMKIIAYDPNVSVEQVKTTRIELVPLQDVFKRADVISLHASINDSSRYVVNAKTLALCKRGFCLLNCAHSELINEDELISALDSGICAAAAIDVFEDDPINMALLGHPRIICTPGLSIATIEAKKRVSLELLERLKFSIEGHWNCLEQSESLPRRDMENES